MSIQIKVDSEAIDLLYRYCMRSPAELGPVVTRLLREWSRQTAGKWFRNPNLIPRMPEIPESRMTSVGIPTVFGKVFKKIVKTLNERTGKVIHEDSLASMLLMAYIKTYKVKEKGKWYRAPKWGDPG